MNRGMGFSPKEDLGFGAFLPYFLFPVSLFLEED